MVKNRKLRIILLVIAIALAYVGFRLASQAGQPGVVIQNDGYAGSGGALILAGGFLIGILVERSGGNGKK